MKPKKLTKLLKYLSLLYLWVVSVESKFYVGRHSGELNSGHLVIPRKVNSNGDFVSHNVTQHHHNHHHYYYHHNNRRLKRNSNSIAEKSQDLHYHIELNNEILHLELQPHRDFILPTMIVERHRRDLRIRKKIEKNHNCHYHGKIRGHSESRVAISACDGLVGHFKTKTNEYYIEPSKNHDAHPINGHPHVVFHRSAVKEKKKRNRHRNKNNYHQHHRRHQHNNKQSSKDNNNSSNNHHNHHHHHHQHHLNHHHHHPRRRHRLQSNCATKEPKRQTETRIEWQQQGKVIVQGGRKIRRNHHHQNYLHSKHSHRHKTTNSHMNYDYNYNKNENNSELVEFPVSNSIDQNKFQYQTSSEEVVLATATPLKAIRQQKQQQHHSQEESCNSDYSFTPTDTSATTINLTATNATTSTPTHSSTQSGRKKRSISSPRHVETLIVADSTMVAFHDDVETYLLTIMNMVSSLYKDPSIGNSIEIVVVKIVLLDEDEAHPDLNLTENAQRNLDTFCGWQHTLNSENEADPYHHDVAILITRKNICGNNCMTLGLANVGGMCKPRQSCSVNEDNGIMLSHTIAHELGHNFGMFHDTAKIGCHGRVGQIVHIMTPTFVADTLQVSWSNCSRKFITHFLDQGLGECLDDKPEFKEEYEYPELPAGALYNAELQCRLQYNLTDENVSSCSSLNEICSQLWCRVNGECVTNMRPTAPGTNCGKHKWCQNGKCVDMQEMTPRHGGWGNWSEWSNCSRKCGGGVSIQVRECNNPVPANGGLFCIGERKRYEICNKEDCPEDEIGFRAQQCSKFNDVPYQGGFYKWLPFFDKFNPCKLFCTDEDDTVIANWADIVEDGTPCQVGTKNMCIDGICKKVGCDWIVDSDKIEDRCGICGGTGENCEPVKEIFNQNFNVTDGYVEIVTIPAKSRHITIKELSNSPNFLSIGKANSSYFYLNGDRLISMPGEFEIAGIESMYDREDEQEIIKIPQPIEHSITLYVIVRGVTENEGIYYEYTLPAIKQKPVQEYNWKLSNWTSCTVTCGGGLQFRKPQCYEGEKLINDEFVCLTNSDNLPPEKMSRRCHENPCESQVTSSHWWAGQWLNCPVTCRLPGISNPVKRRPVQCLDQNENILPEIMCDLAIRPNDVEICDDLMPYCSDRSDGGGGMASDSIFKNEILLD